MCFSLAPTLGLGPTRAQVQLRDGSTSAEKDGPSVEKVLLGDSAAHAGRVPMHPGSPLHASATLLSANAVSFDMDTLDVNLFSRLLQPPPALFLVAALLLAGALLPPGHAFGQSILSQSPPEGPEGPQPRDARGPDDPRGLEDPPGPEDECEDYDNDGDCDPIVAVIGAVATEYLPQITDGARTSHGWMPGGGAYGGRLEWTLHRSQGRRLMLGVGAQTVPVRALQPGANGPPFQPKGRDGALALTLGGSVPLCGLGVPAERSFRGVAETTLLVGDPGRQLRLTIGPRYRVGLNQNALTVDLVVGTNLGTQGFAPQAGLRIGWTWD